MGVKKLESPLEKTENDPFLLNLFKGLSTGKEKTKAFERYIENTINLLY